MALLRCACLSAEVITNASSAPCQAGQYLYVVHVCLHDVQAVLLNEALHEANALVVGCHLRRRGSAESCQLSACHACWLRKACSRQQGVRLSQRTRIAAEAVFSGPCTASSISGSPVLTWALQSLMLSSRLRVPLMPGICDFSLPGACSSSAMPFSCTRSASVTGQDHCSPWTSECSSLPRACTQHTSLAAL